MGRKRVEGRGKSVEVEEDPWKRRSRRGSRSEETPGVLCSASLLIAVNIRDRALDDRDRVDNEIADK